MVFDDSTSSARGGSMPARARAAGLEVSPAGVSVPVPKAAAEVKCVVAGILARADSIADLDLL